VLHLRHQGANLAVLGRIGVSLLGSVPTAAPTLPGPEVRGSLRGVSPRLVADFVRWSGGDPRTWRGQVPPHFFPQWGFPLLGRTLRGIPYPISRVLNQGCRITMNGPLPEGERLLVTARLESIQEDERKVRLHQVLTTGPASQPEALIADIYSVIPRPRKPDPDAPREPPRERPRVPQDYREVGGFHAKRWAGLEFALLTGDFNPVHWVGFYARAAGFKNVILHGFATMAKATECILRQRLSGDVAALASVDVRFTSPLVLPTRARIFLGHEAFEGAHGIAVGTARGGPAAMLGRFTIRS
jgi:acyl dehydratase